MTKIAIFHNESDAIVFENQVHEYLKLHRQGYNAERWCNPERSANGQNWFVKLPPEKVNESVVNADITEDMPTEGNQCTAGKWYLHRGHIIKCNLSHARTKVEPHNTPALFSHFRDISKRLEWKEGEKVEQGWERIKEEKRYEVIKPHITDDAVAPEVAPDKWKLK